MGHSGGKNDRNGGTLVAPLKSFGQNFLKNPMVVQGIVEKAEIRSSDVVFEIGPGTGNLTVELLKRAKKVRMPHAITSPILLVFRGLVFLFGETLAR